jgi:hypothetical protein
MTLWYSGSATSQCTAHSLVITKRKCVCCAVRPASTSPCQCHSTIAPHSSSLHVELTREVNGRSLGTFQKQSSENRGTLDRKVLWPCVYRVDTGSALTLASYCQFQMLSSGEGLHGNLRIWFYYHSVSGLLTLYRQFHCTEGHLLCLLSFWHTRQPPDSARVTTPMDVNLLMHSIHTIALRFIN